MYDSYHVTYAAVLTPTTTDHWGLEVTKYPGVLLGQISTSDLLLKYRRNWFTETLEFQFKSNNMHLIYLGCIYTFKVIEPRKSSDKLFVTLVIVISIPLIIHAATQSCIQHLICSRWDFEMGLKMGSNGYVDVGDGCWRRNMLATTMRSW